MEGEFVEIMRTGVGYEIDMAANTLSENGIPYIRRQHMGALITSMPMTPTPGLGVSWSVSVPRVAIDDATGALSHLPFPIRLHAEQIDFRPSPSQRRWWNICVLICAVLLVGSFLAGLALMLGFPK